MKGPEEGFVADDDWYARWFGEDYLSLYPHRDEEEAERAVHLVLRRAEVESGAPVLDLACGAGRHVQALISAGLPAIGLDLSATLLRRARLGAGRFVRADMRRIPFADGAFHLVTNFFTSFGYFSERAEDIRVVDEVARVLRVGGWFAFDFLNAEKVRNGLRLRDERTIGGHRVVQTRQLSADRQVVEKRIVIHPEVGAPRTYHERVRLYDTNDLIGLLHAHDLHVLHEHGDYDGAPRTAESPRVVLIGRAH